MERIPVRSLDGPEHSGRSFVSARWLRLNAAAASAIKAPGWLQAALL